jgi:tetratricopeptide (TPR) repeat protein/transcriptional regulator with XRE-family HTH domain
VSASGRDAKVLGEFLFQARRTAGLTQEELAAKTGMSARAISDLERGRTLRPRRSSLQLLARALELSDSAYSQLLGLCRELAPRSAPADLARMPSDAEPGGGADQRARRTDSQPGATTTAGESLPGGLYSITPVQVPGDVGRVTAPVPAQLPADIPDFTGRADEVGELRELLADGAGDSSPGAVPVVLVVGSGGLGKTTLAVHAAHMLASEFPDGQLYANLLGATQPADPAEVLSRFLRDLGADPARIPLDMDERAALYRTSVADRRLLIVLDDAKDGAQVGPLLPGSGSCGVVVTARSHMPDLAGATIIELGVLSHEQAHALFTQAARRERALAEPGATEDVLAACAGLPLAIRIAGARLAARGGWTVRAMADRLADERKRLDELRAGNLAVRASFEVSFASLPGPATPGGVEPGKSFRMLGLWTGPSFSLSAAAALLGEPEDAVTDALEVLVDAHLLESPEPDRYRFHDLLRVYAADRARTQETEQDRTAAITRLLTWYLHATATAAAIISPGHARVPLGQLPAHVEPRGFTSLDDALAWCETERSALVAATRLAVSSGLREFAWKLPAAAMSFYYRRWHLTDWVTTHEIGLASARSIGDRRGEAWILNRLGVAYGVKHMEETVDCLEQSFAIFDEIGDGLGAARAANNLANAYFELGRFEEAKHTAERGLDLAGRVGNRFGQGHALNILGCAYRELGKPSGAVGYLQQALAIFRELGARHEEADSLSELGETYLILGQVSDGIACLDASLLIDQDTRNRRFEAVTLQRLSRGRRLAGDVRLAVDLLREALRVAEDAGDQMRAAHIRADLEQLSRTEGAV